MDITNSIKEEAANFIRLPKNSNDCSKTKYQRKNQSNLRNFNYQICQFSIFFIPTACLFISFMYGFNHTYFSRTFFLLFLRRRMLRKIIWRSAFDSQCGHWGPSGHMTDSSQRRALRSVRTSWPWRGWRGTCASNALGRSGPSCPCRDRPLFALRTWLPSLCSRGGSIAWRNPKVKV